MLAVEPVVVHVTPDVVAKRRPACAAGEQIFAAHAILLMVHT